MLSNIPAIIFLILGGSILTIGDIVFKFYTEKPSSVLYISGLVTYLIGLLFLVQSFKTENIAVASVIFVIINVVTLSLVSWLSFGEKLSPLQIGGVLIAFVAIWLLEIGN